ncbi:aromatic ring-opening dioxygenase family protein [Boeremia exigua]|uniref:aromatic ring-opening dioxygenase family protein n=1 Tax=Boeremia exigua TaxID=749465 RepID=UPI001E8EDA80|nr:aromatic ring-opening dioxygenase family protein [Boeremia exigua]KAH6618434.1 aromatic ring-opening dioxygenase family protein [Boeremia exigua]
MIGIAPVFLFAHGSTMMLGEESEPAKVWEQVGNEALRRGIKRIVMMGAHWESPGDTIEISMNPGPKMLPVGSVKDSRYMPYKVQPDLEGGEKVIKLLKSAGFNVKAAPKFDWIHDTFLIIIRMFPHCVPLPTTIVSMNARYESHFHLKIGAALRPLRYEDTLIIGSGGSVHNLYRNHWSDMMLYRDNFSQPVPPGTWALEFRQAVEDNITNNTGPELRRAITRMMKHPRYKEAHGTDDHWMASLFAVGAAGGKEDEGPNTMIAECWELVNMCNTQYQLGSWDAYRTIQ